MTNFNLGSVSIAKLFSVVSLALLLTACDGAVHRMGDLDLDHDICVAETTDRLGVGDVRGTLSLSRFIRKSLQKSRMTSFLNELDRLIAAHNEEVTDDDSREYTFSAWPPVPRPVAPYLAASNSNVCTLRPPTKPAKKCRYFRYWTFRPIASRLMARIAFKNTVNAKSFIKSCDLAQFKEQLQ